MLLATWLGRYPNIIFEPNASQASEQVLARIFYTNLRPAMKFLHKMGKKAIVTGCPGAPGIFLHHAAASGKPFRLLITGGSQEHFLSTDSCRLHGSLPHAERIGIVHQTGGARYNAVRTAYAARNSRGGCPISYDMANALPGRTYCLPGQPRITAAEIARR